jgi:excisionase family DNA binding protein
MNPRRDNLAELPDWPAMLSVEEAARYCGIARDTFESLVKKKILPGAAKLPIRRKLWHRATLDAALAKRSPAADGYEARRKAWGEGRPADAG